MDKKITLWVLVPLILSCLLCAAIPSAQSRGSVLNIPGATFTFVAPVANTVWKIGNQHTLQWKSANLPSDCLIQFFLDIEETPPVIGGFGFGQTYSISAGRLKLKVPTKYCGGECGPVETVKAGKYKITAIVYGPPNVYGGRPKILRTTSAPFRLSE